MGGQIASSVRIVLAAPRIHRSSNAIVVDAADAREIVAGVSI